MKIVALALNRKGTPLALRERLSFPPRDLGPALEAMRGYVPEGAILSTCHRVELYSATPEPRRTEAELKRFWAELRGVPVREFEPHLCYLVGRKAVEHLLAVACGLDSPIIGEPQILGQIREALRKSLDRRSMGRVLSALFRQAITCGKRARTETGVGRNAASISYAAVELARQTFGDLRSSRVLLVGAGKMGDLATRALLEKGVAGITVVGRTPERAKQLALRCGCAVALSQLEDALRDCDIVITCTSAPHHVIRKEMVERAVLQRDGRPLFLIDIAVPRDVEPVVGEVAGVHLFNVDDLESAVAAGMRERRAEARKVLPIIEEEVALFERWLVTQRIVPCSAQRPPPVTDCRPLRPFDTSLA
jgi:glutamyl-tRNA reductase